MNNSTATSPPVSTRFLGLMVAGLTIAAVVIVIIVAMEGSARPAMSDEGLIPSRQSSPTRRSHTSTSARASVISSPRTARPSPIVDRGHSRV